METSQAFINASAMLSAEISWASEIMESYTEEDWQQVPGTSWTRLQILGHLIDSAVNNHQRFVRGIYEETPHIAYDQNKWNELQSFRNSKHKMLLGLWIQYNQYLAAYLLSIDPSHTNKKVNCGKTVMTMAEIALDYVDHMKHHLLQIIGKGKLYI